MADLAGSACGRCCRALLPACLPPVQACAGLQTPFTALQAVRAAAEVVGVTPPSPRFRSSAMPRCLNMQSARCSRRTHGPYGRMSKEHSGWLQGQQTVASGGVIPPRASSGDTANTVAEALGQVTSSIHEGKGGCHGGIGAGCCESCKVKRSVQPGTTGQLGDGGQVQITPQNPPALSQQPAVCKHHSCWFVYICGGCVIGTCPFLENRETAV